MKKYAGYDWLYKQPSEALEWRGISNLGARFADLLGQVFLGIYHLENEAIQAVEWDSLHSMECDIGWSMTAQKIRRMVVFADQYNLYFEIKAGESPSEDVEGLYLPTLKVRVWEAAGRINPLSEVIETKLVINTSSVFATATQNGGAS